MDDSGSAHTFIATTGDGLACASGTLEGEWVVESLLPGVLVNCIACEATDHSILYAGTDGQGVLRSKDKGKTWQPSGLEGKVVKALAVSATTPGIVYAGVRPAGMYRSRDGGSAWEELEGFRKVKEWFWFSPADKPFTAYVQSIVLSGSDHDIVVAGIEAGAVVVSTDGGLTWMRHRRGSLRDCHTLAGHPDGRWVYEAGGSGGGAAFSNDSGLTWKKHSAGLDRHYGWAVAADPADPQTWYVSMAPGPLKAHNDGKAEAYIFRSRGGGPWQKLGGGLPQPLRHMPYSLLSDPQAPGHIYVALSSGDVWHSSDYGDAWSNLPFSLGSVNRSVIML